MCACACAVCWVTMQNVFQAVNWGNNIWESLIRLFPETTLNLSPLSIGPSSRANINCKARKTQSLSFPYEFLRVGHHAPGGGGLVPQRSTLPWIESPTSGQGWITDIPCAPSPILHLEPHQLSGKAFLQMFFRPLRLLNAASPGSWP